MIALPINLNGFDVEFATKYTFRYNRVVQATINERKVFIWLIIPTR